MVPKIPTVIPTVDATDTPPPRIIPIIIKIFIFIASTYSCLILLIIYMNNVLPENVLIYWNLLFFAVSLVDIIKSDSGAACDRIMHYACRFEIDTDTDSCTQTAK